MSQFERLKCELHQGGEKELRQIIERMRNLSATPIEREFDSKWALVLKDRVKAGRAIPFQWVIAKMPSGGRSIDLRINGQHSSWALHELLKEGELPDELAIFHTTYSVPDQAAAVMLFRQFDSPGSSRDKTDISGAYQCWHEDLRHCNRSVLEKAVGGTIWYRREVEEKPVESGLDIYQLFDEKRLHPFFLMMHEVLGNGKSNELKRVPIMAAAFGSWQEDARRAEEFWRLAALGSNRTEEDAASDLDTEVLRILEDKEKPSAFDWYAKCHKAWDAFDKGIRVSNFKVSTKKKGLPRFGDENGN